MPPSARMCFFSSLCEREKGEGGGRGWCWLVPSLALCNMIRAHHGEAGLCGPSSCRPTAPHGDWIEPQWTGNDKGGPPSSVGWLYERAQHQQRLTQQRQTQRWGWREVVASCYQCLLRSASNLSLLQKIMPSVPLKDFLGLLFACCRGPCQ